MIWCHRPGSKRLKQFFENTFLDLIYGTVAFKILREGKRISQKKINEKDVKST